jgi:hypothetical protein
VRIPAILFSGTRFIRHSERCHPSGSDRRDPWQKPKPNVAGFLDPAAARLGMRGWLGNAEFGLPSPFVVSSANSVSRPGFPTAVVVMSSVVETSLTIDKGRYLEIPRLRSE